MQRALADGKFTIRMAFRQGVRAGNCADRILASDSRNRRTHSIEHQRCYHAATIPARSCSNHEHNRMAKRADFTANGCWWLSLDRFQRDFVISRSGVRISSPAIAFSGSLSPLVPKWCPRPNGSPGRAPSYASNCWVMDRTKVTKLFDKRVAVRADTIQSG